NSTGILYDGGTVSVSVTGDSSALVAVPGALVDVSGVRGAIDTFGFGTSASPNPIAIWSDAGSIALTGSAILFDGTLRALPGSPSANGGSLSGVQALESGQLTVIASGNVAVGPGGTLAATDAIPAASRGRVYFTADRLNGSGIVDLSLANLAGGTIKGDEIRG